MIVPLRSKLLPVPLVNVPPLCTFSIAVLNLAAPMFALRRPGDRQRGAAPVIVTVPVAAAKPHTLASQTQSRSGDGGAALN